MRRIKNPLPFKRRAGESAEEAARRRSNQLHNALTRLNDQHGEVRIVFERDYTKEGIRWTVVGVQK